MIGYSLESFYKSARKSLLYIIATLAALSNLQCNNGEGFNGASSSIADSKRKGVYVASYRPLSNPYPVNDTIAISVKEAWLEQMWRHTNSPATVQLDSGYQLKIRSDKVSLYNYLETWVIGKSFAHHLDFSGDTALYGEFSTIPVSDTLAYEVIAGNTVGDSSAKPIGTFKLVRIR